MLATVNNEITRDDLEEQFRAIADNFGLNVEVFSDGPITARVAFVGEGPGESEIRKRLPFVGGSGKFMWQAVSRYGLDRNNVYSTNVVKRQISLSRAGNERNAVHHDEVAKWVDLVRWELSQLPRLEIIFVLGGYALEALTENQGITKWRGSVLTVDLPNGRRGKVVCAFNPAYPLREPKFEPIFLMDCRKLDLVNRNVFREHYIEKIINPSYREARAYIKDLKKRKQPVALDTEFINQELACIGLASDPHEAFCINFRDFKSNRYTLEQEVDLLYDIQGLCDSNRIVAQNGMFDSYASWLHQRLIIPIWFDILLAHHSLLPQLPHNLAFLVSCYTTHPYYKDEGKAWREGGDIDGYWEYNCCDAALTIASYYKLSEELKKTKMESFFFDHVMRAQPHLVSATVHGVAVDLSVKDKILKLVEEDVAQSLQSFHDLVGELTDDPEYKPNPNSWPQMKALYFERLKLQGKGQSTNETNRQYMIKNPNTSPLAKEMLTAVDKFKEEDKFRGTYAEAQPCDDGRFRCEYKQYGVSKAPGRLSSSKLLVTKRGGNMQNQPVRARGMYVSDPGTVMLYFDLAQAEAQVVGFRADIPVWKAQFAKAKKDGSYDCHRALASEMFKIPYDQVPTKDWDENLKPTKRYVSKRCRHGLNYRMQESRLAEVTGLPFYEARRAFKLYHAITPQLRSWWEEETKQFTKTKEIYNALGRCLRVIQRIDDDVLESIIAYYPQSTIGDKIVQVWYQCEEDDGWPNDARIAIDVHDNLVALASPRTAKSALRIMKKYAESPIWIQDVYKRRKPEPLSIACELKMSYPSRWDDKKRGFVRDDKNGLHRWSEMEVVKL
jgi:uracil-DNA glycosylase family 4